MTLYTDFDGDSESGDMDDDVGEAHIEFDGHDSDTFDLSYYIGVSTLLLEFLWKLLIIDSNKIVTIEIRVVPTWKIIAMMMNVTSRFAKENVMIWDLRW